MEMISKIRNIFDKLISSRRKMHSKDKHKQQHRHSGAPHHAHKEASVEPGDSEETNVVSPEIIDPAEDHADVHGSPDLQNDNIQADLSAPRIAELEAKLAEAEDKALRVRAEFDNYRKRVYKDLTDARIASKQDAAAPFLAVLDNLKLAVDAAEKTKDFGVLNQGMQMIHAEFQKALAELGIETINAVGATFDPRLHDAIAEQASPDVPEGTVISQWRCGYKMGDRLLRPCAVVVSSGPAKNEDPKTPEN